MHTGADPGGGGGRDPPPPCSRPPIFFFSTNFLSICGLRHTGNVQGGGVLVNMQEWGVFAIFWRADDVTRTMSKGGVCACECLDPPPPSGNPVSAPGITCKTLQTIHMHLYRLCGIYHMHRRRNGGRGCQPPRV